MNWQHTLLNWYDAHRRDLPWRATSDPYAIWVSEIMLQQTQVATVIPYWQRWMQRFPTVESLAEADEQEVLSMWQGLGYYRRCRLLQQGARFVAVHGLPSTAEDWRHVPGVGAYTAGAIASIAQGEPAPLVDGNVERVYARLVCDSESDRVLHKNAWTWAAENVHPERPGFWNQALMELGATVCTPKNPNCSFCPVESLCAARAKGMEREIPAKSAKPKPIALKHVVWIPWFGGEVGIRQIPNGSWWEGMWEFPRVEITPRKGRTMAPVHECDENAELRELLGTGWLQYLGEVKHTVTHHRISIEVHLLRCEDRTEGLEWKRLSELEGLPMPSPQRKIIALSAKFLDSAQAPA